MRMHMLKQVLVVVLVLSLAATLGCQASISGATKDDTTVTDTSKGLAQTGVDVQEYKGPRLRVGVVNFLNKTPSKTFGIGEAAADILGTILQKTGRFIIIPQQDMKSLLEHQAAGLTGAIDPNTAAKLGQVLGLNAIVTGAITAYSEAEEGQDFVVYQSKTQVAKVTVDYRVVDTTTGVQLLADSGAGIYRKKASQVLGMGSKSTFDTDLRDGALRDALTKAMVNMLKQMSSRKWSGRIAQVSGKQVYINAGKRSGLEINTVLDVYRAGEDIIDPVTRVKIGQTEDLIGAVRILKNDLGDSGDLSAASPVSGSMFKVGDIVKFKD